jgi:hypothetical protein
MHVARISKEKAYLRWKEERLGRLIVLSTSFLLIWMPPASTSASLLPTPTLARLHAGCSCQMCPQLCLPHPARRIPLFYPILEFIAGGSFQHVDSPNTRPSIDMCRNETAEPVPVMPIEPPETFNTQARLEAYRRSLNEYIARLHAVLDTESEEDDYLRFLEKLVPLYHKKQEMYTSRRVPCESFSTADEMYQWELEEKVVAEKIAKLGEDLAKEKKYEATQQAWEDWFLTQKQTVGIIPIKLQVVYWAFSALAVTMYQLLVGNLTMDRPWMPIVLMSATTLSLPHLLFHQVWVRFYWYSLLGLAAASGIFVQPCVNAISCIPLNDRETMAVHFCLAFYIISEAEW